MIILTSLTNRDVVKIVTLKTVKGLDTMVKKVKVNSPLKPNV